MPVPPSFPRLASLGLFPLLAVLVPACGPPEGAVEVPDLGRTLELDALPDGLPDGPRNDAFIPILDSGPPLVFVDGSAPSGDLGPLCMSRMPEICNGLDDDCDGEIDETQIIGNVCWAKNGDCVAEQRRLCDANAVPGCPAPPAGTACRDKPLTFVVLSDYGSGNGGESIIADVIRGWNPDFVVTAGDNNFPAGASDTIDRNVGEYFGSFIGEYHGRFGAGSDDNRFWPALGHIDWVAANAQPYLDFFTLPGNERYYDVNLGLVHLFVLDSNAHEPDGIDENSVQAQWFHTAITASKACLKLVVFHNAPYTSATRGEANGGVPMRWPFKAWGVSAVVSGHDRVYERLSVDDLPYFVVGYSGGMDNHTFADPPRPESVFRYRDKPGALKITVTGTDVTYDFINNRNEQIDELKLPLACP